MPVATARPSTRSRFMPDSYARLQQPFAAKRSADARGRIEASP